MGAMAASIPLNNTCWLRLMAVEDGLPMRRILRTLWENLREELIRSGIHTVAVLIVNDWLSPIMSMLDFDLSENIITLRREGRFLPHPRFAPRSIHIAEFTDLVQMTKVDQSAFHAPWQLNYEDLRQAMRISAHCTVVIENNKVIAYQLSTQYRKNGHLARLAVLPEYQGQGLGGLLLDNLIRRFMKRGVVSITVNTQESNHHSQRLYERYGFKRNGYDLPVWLSSLSPDEDTSNNE